MNAHIEWQGLEEILGKLSAVPAQALRAAGGSLYRQGEAIMARSKQDFVPVDLGVLRDSGYVAMPQYDGQGVTVEIGFGGAAADYAVVQHEDVSLHHPNGGEAKYLEKPLLEHAQHLVADVAADVRAELGLGG